MITFESNFPLAKALYNWKFSLAETCIENEPDSQIHVIAALAATYGNCGQFGGDMGQIIEAAVRSIAYFEE